MAWKKISEYTYGTHIYMAIELDGKKEEIDVYIVDNQERYYTTGDGNADKRMKIIHAFKALY